MLRFAQSGRDILRCLDARSIGPVGWREALQEMPPHCGYFVADLARWCAERWCELADQIQADVDKATPP